MPSALPSASPHASPRRHPAIPVFTLALAALLLGIGPGRAADITWRGGTGDSFHQKLNWGLPSDLPGGLTPAQAESFRRVPGSADRAIVREATVRVTGKASVANSDWTGKLVVDGPQAVFLSQNFKNANLTDLFDSVEIIGGGQCFASNPGEFTGLVRIEHGSLQVGPAVALASVTLVGPNVNPLLDRSTLVGQRNDPPTRIRGRLTLEGEPGTTVVIQGRVLVEQELRWEGADVGVGSFGGAGGTGLVQIGDGLQPAAFRLGDGTATARWNFTATPEAELVFAARSFLQHGTGNHVFRGRIEFVEGSLGAPDAQPDSAAIRFDEAQVTFTGSRSGAQAGLVLAGPLRFEGASRANFQGPTDAPSAGPTIRFDAALRSDGQGFQPIVFTGNSRTTVTTPISLLAVRLDELARVTLAAGDPQTQAGRGRWLVTHEHATVEFPAELHLEAGQLEGRVEILSKGRLRVGRDLPSDSFGNATFNGEIDNQGTVEFRGGLTVPSTRARFTGRGVNQPTGLFRYVAGHGLSTGQPFVLVNFGTLVVEGPEPDRPPGASVRSGVASTLLNDGAASVEPGAIGEVAEGDNFRDGLLHLASGATWSITGRPLSDNVPFVDRDGSAQVRPVQRLFHFRKQSGVLLSLGSTLELIPANGGGPLENNGGISIEDDLDVESLVLGGPTSSRPRVVFGAGTPEGGPELRITGQLRWHGGAFLGNGANFQPGTGHVLVEPSAQAFLRFPPVSDPPQFGAELDLLSGVEFRVRGSFEIQTGNAIQSDSASSFVFEPDAKVRVLVAANFNRSTARFLNHAPAVKEGAGEFVISGLWQNLEGGTLALNGGSLTLRNGTLEGPGFLVDTVSAVTANPGRFRDAHLQGGLVRILQPTTFEGSSSLDRLQLEGVSSQDLLDGGGNTPVTVTVRKSFDWLAGGVDLASGGQLILGPQSENRIESLVPPFGGGITPAGFFRSGRIVNQGRTRFVVSRPTDFQMFNAATFENQGELRLAGPGTAFRRNFSGERFTVLNSGLITLDTPLPEGGLLTIDGRLVNQGSGQLRFARPAPALAPVPGPRRGQPQPAAPFPPNAGAVTFANLITLDAGVLDGRGFDINFAEGLTVNGGEIHFGRNGEGRVQGTFTFNQGSVRYEGPASGRFARATTLGSGATLFVDQDTTLEVPNGLILAAGSRLSGLGTVAGNVVNSAGTIAPGDPEVALKVGPLRIAGTVTFGSNATFQVRAPVAPTDAGFDQLILPVGVARLDGRLRVLPILNGTTPNPSPIPILSFTNHEGAFRELLGDPFLDGSQFTAQFGVTEGATNRVELVIAAGGPAADLVLTGTAPLLVAGNGAFTEEFVVRNLGPDPSGALIVTVGIPPGVVLLNSEPAGNLRPLGLNIPMPGLAAATTATVRVQLQAPAGPVGLASRATLTGPLPDPLPDNNTAGLVIAVLPGGTFATGTLELGATGGLTLELATLEGVKYRLERSVDLAVWTPVESFTGDGTSRSVPLPGAQAPESVPGLFRLALISPP